MRGRRVHDFVGGRVLCLAGASLAVLLWIGGAWARQDEPTQQGAGVVAQAPKRPPITELYDRRTQEAVHDALRWLAGQQESAGSGVIGQPNRYPVAQTSMAGLAFLASGSLPGRGPYGESIAKAVEYIVSRQDRAGYISEADTDASASRIHGHGFATLFLAQLYGANRTMRVKGRDLREALDAAVSRSVKCQTESGGWGYVPNRQTFDEASTTICVMQGLRAAQEVGIRVPEKTIQQAQRYVQDCRLALTWTTTSGEQRTGYTFKYSLMNSVNRSSFPLTAAAVATLQTAGIYDEESVKGGLRFLEDFFFETMQAPPEHEWYQRFQYYSHFYAAQAMFHAPDEDLWRRYYPRMRGMFLQSPHYRKPYWDSSSGDGDDVYATAIVALVLQIPLGFLPLFQR